MWYYPIGVLIGFIVYSAIAAIAISKEDAPVVKPHIKGIGMPVFGGQHFGKSKFDGTLYHHEPKNKDKSDDST